MNLDDFIETIVTSAVGETPYVGGVLSAIIGFIWPTSGPDLWAQIEGNVQNLVTQDIAENNLNALQQQLQGIKNDINQYLGITDPQEAQETLVSIQTTINTLVPQFLSGDPAKGFSCFWGMALLHIAVLRDLCKVFPDSGTANQNQLAEMIQCYYTFAVRALHGISYPAFLNEIQTTITYNSLSGGEIQATLTITDKTTGEQILVSQLVYNEFCSSPVGEWVQQQQQHLFFLHQNIATTTVFNQLNNLAGNAISKFMAAYPIQQGTGMQILQSIMTPTDYSALVNQYLPSYTWPPVYPPYYNQ